MVDSRNLIIFLSQLKQYPVRLARIIGCEKAVLWFELFTKHGDIEFEYTDQALIGILNGKKLYQELVDLEYLLLEGDKYKINFNKIIEKTDGASLTKECKPPFTDSTFLKLCSDYIRMMITKGRKIKMVELYSKFEGKTLEQSIKALNTSLNNNWVTLFFDNGRNEESNTGSSKGVGSGKRTWNSGGKQTEGSERKYKPTDI